MSAQSRGLNSEGGDLLRRYLDEIGAHPLLSAADEVELGNMIATGRVAIEQIELGGLDAQARTDLDAVIERASKARRRFIQSNLRLVVSVARRYQGSGLALLDLIQEGNLGLMRAVEKFDPSRGFKFSTYATWWIRQAIGRAIAETSRTIKVPAHVRESTPAIMRSIERLSEHSEHFPTPQEVATDTGLTREIGRAHV